MKRLYFSLLALVALSAHAQLISGPMLGPVELRDAVIWVEVGGATKAVQVVYSRQGGSGAPMRQDYKLEARQATTPLHFTLPDLEPATTYKYSLLIDGKLVPGGTFTTKTLWQWR
ncbi:MAG: hypothetical protein EOP50_14825, partial [Sphingobacteriales bacterium]